jgi:tetratricopeptide (TPR) repeat protein
MDAKPARGKPLALEPAEDLTPVVETGPAVDASASAEAKPKRELHISTTDEYLAAAAKEYEEGQIDAALWRKAGDQSRGDPSLVIAAYLRARATALRLQSKQAEPSPGRARSAAEKNHPNDDSETLPDDSTRIADAPRGLQAKIKYAAAGAAALALVVVGVWLIASPRQSEPALSPVASAAASKSSRPAPSALPVNAGPAANRPTQSGPDLAEVEAKVQELKKTGNWNVLVLYATEWTRKQPTSGAAWHELSVGYLNLRQFGDALDAAKKAVQVAPDNALLWSDLGRINLTVQRPTDAGIAFDRALALSPDDADALCGAAAVAQQQGRRGDADAFSKRVNSDGGCRDASEGTSVASAATGSVSRKVVPSPGR